MGKPVTLCYTRRTGYVGRIDSRDTSLGWFLDNPAYTYVTEQSSSRGAVEYLAGEISACRRVFAFSTYSGFERPTQHHPPHVIGHLITTMKSRILRRHPFYIFHCCSRVNLVNVRQGLSVGYSRDPRYVFRLPAPTPSTQHPMPFSPYHRPSYKLSSL
ncbi:hypothetical protein BDQ17DRAFT_746382 [Cyathus striatus]|nr:hypothetical protein BDQ17DRAFT_746382 [Cyathus striatus]